MLAKKQHTKMPGKNIQLGKRYEKHMTKISIGKSCCHVAAWTTANGAVTAA
jgi:hypothetical protein